MGLAPWTTLKDLRAPAEIAKRTDPENQGRKIFMQEGCWHCHTQFVRPVAGEPLRYGPPSKAMEYVGEIPQLFGTRRVGPDLAREAGKRSDDWHLAHFYNPRSTAPWSVMPGLPWLYEKQDGKMVPTEKAKALTAYVQSLGRNTQTLMEEKEKSFRESFVAGKAPESSPFLLERGEKLFLRECSGCHGIKGDGKGMAENFLNPPAENLTQIRPTPEYVFTVLNKGIAGSAMSNFRDYHTSDLWALSHYVNRLSENAPKVEGPTRSEELIIKGQKIFQEVCAACHDSEGRGKGMVAQALAPPPPDLTMLRPFPHAAVSVLDHGVEGTAMTSYSYLSSEEKWGLGYYLETLWEGEK